MSSAQSDVLTGVVESFDAGTGMGTVRVDGGEEWPFHCVEVADGSRSIEIGEKVTFLVAFRTLRREAVSIAKG